MLLLSAWGSRQDSAIIMKSVVTRRILLIEAAQDAGSASAVALDREPAVQAEAWCR